MTSQFDDRLMIGYRETMTGFEKNSEFHNPSHNSNIHTLSW